MLTCNCTLCYDNPNACKSCSVYLNYYNSSIQGFIELVNKPNWVDWRLYNPDTHELVEKKDWKINQLKERLKSSKKELEGCNAEIQYNMVRKGNILISIDEIEKELKELEQSES